ncbi:hypothetical protein [Chengkuizengella axinellae]|uniref:Peptidase C39-like domain-containing protein n=1 Tax=Chengkuizengella axinellae TaxID=3064388 RepID=A0ABT9IYC5_9BACL|nr:hypothetical protein [Chengkuizengella sp. 2205SS18-9]MDP5274258.1 hypothetical protein [Chengkuizengella sp. 2205SS18-9]
MGQKKTESNFLLFLLITYLQHQKRKSGSLEKVQLLKDAVLLCEKDILTLAHHHIHHYLKEDMQTKGKEIEASSDFIPLYDFQNNHFAYMVPLVEEGEIGYIVVGAIEDGYDCYEVFIKENIVKEIKSFMFYLSKSSNLSTQLVYLPSTSYVIQLINDQGIPQKYFDISYHLGLDDEITDDIHHYHAEIGLENLYKHIRKDDNKKRINNILDRHGNETSDHEIDEVMLSTERNSRSFVPIYNNNVYSYGGNQTWWKDEGKSIKSIRGCGPVAAANLTYYLSIITNPTQYGELYADETSNYHEFMKHMDVLYEYIAPRTYGAVSVSEFVANVEQYASDRGVSLHAVWREASFTVESTAEYIKEGLNLNSPIATLNLSIPKITGYPYQWHWMTITKYWNKNEDKWIVVSTWGQRRIINYNQHLDAITSFLSVGGGFMYFK